MQEQHWSLMQRLWETKERCTLGSGLRFLYLFSGPDVATSVGHAVEVLGGAMECYDIAIDKGHDLCDDSLWSKILAELRQGNYHGGIASPPCGSFSACRRQDPGEAPGPAALRSDSPPGIYGLKDAPQEKKEYLRIGTLCAFRAASMVEELLALSPVAEVALPASIETPERRDGQPSVFKLPEVIILDQDSRISIIRGVQCPYGALSPKPSEMLGTMALRDWVRECPHPAQAWRVPWSGKRHLQPHPPLRGRQRAIPEADWCKSMLRRRMPGGPWLTQESENYPPDFNNYLAKSLVLHARARVVLREQQAPRYGLSFGLSYLSQKLGPLNFHIRTRKSG